MELTEEQLHEIENLAAAFMKVKEIAVIMGLPVDTLKAALEDEQSAVFMAHKRGHLKSKYQINKRIIDLASAGSSPAQAMAQKLILDKEIDE